MLFPMLGGLLQLALLIGIGVAITRAIRSRRETGTAEGAPGSLRRLFLYGMLYGTLHVAAWGLARLLAAFADQPELTSATRVAEPLAMTVVALPVLYLLGRWAMRAITDPAERTVAFSFYLNLTLVTSVVVVLVTGIATGYWLLGGDTFEPIAIAALPIWAVIWAGHWQVWRRYQTEVSAVHLYIASAAGLLTAAIFGGILLTYALSAVMDARSGLDLEIFDDEAARVSLAGLAVSLGVWGWHWLGNGLRRERDVVWHAYTILFAVLGGLITFVLAASITLFEVLQWWFGDPEETSAVRHFFDVIPAVAALLIGAAIWVYHRFVLQAAKQVRNEVSRVYDYVVAAVGLAAAAFGIVVLIVALQQAVFPSDAAGDSDSSRQTFLAAITSLLVGAPLWNQAWFRAGGYLRRNVTAEASSPTRRFYLFGILGVSGAIGFGSLLALLTQLFNAFFEDSGPLREDLRVPIALLVTVSVVAVYHWRVFRAERGDVTAPVRPKDITLVTGSAGLADGLRRATGAHVSLMLRDDVNGEAPAVEDLAAAVEADEHQRLLVLAGPSDRIEVVPLRQSG